MTAAVSQEAVRRRNLGALLRHVHRNGAMSRAELTTALGLNRSTIGALTADLAAAGLVVEEAGTRRHDRAGRAGRAGRPSLTVTPCSDTVCAYAVSVEVDQVRVARVGLGGTVRAERSAPRPPAPEAPQEDPVPALVTDLVAAVRPAGGQSVRTVGCGVALSGRVRTAAGTVVPAPPQAETTTALHTALEGVLPPGTPVVAGATGDLAALAEHTRGTATGYSHVLYLCGDGGITAGVIADGRPLTGYGGVSGDVGHMVVHPGGERCGCGSRGCWETVAGEQALLCASGRPTNPEDTGREAVRAIVAAADRGDATARAAVRSVAGWLGLGVGNLVNVFGPEMVLFGESLRDVYLAAAAPLRSRLHMVGLASRLSYLKLRTPALADDAPLVGAAELAFEGLLADPLLPRPPDGRS